MDQLVLYVLRAHIQRVVQLLVAQPVLLEHVQVQPGPHHVHPVLLGIILELLVQHLVLRVPLVSMHLLPVIQLVHLVQLEHIPPSLLPLVALHVPRVHILRQVLHRVHLVLLVLTRARRVLVHVHLALLDNIPRLGPQLAVLVQRELIRVLPVQDLAQHVLLAIILLLLPLHVLLVQRENMPQLQVIQLVHHVLPVPMLRPLHQ